MVGVPSAKHFGPLCVSSRAPYCCCIAWLAGEEFAVLLPDADAEAAIALAQAIRVAVLNLDGRYEVSVIQIVSL